MLKRLFLIFIISLTSFSVAYSSGNITSRIVKGVVEDKAKNEAIDNAPVIIYVTTRAVTQNLMGEFTLEVNYGDIISVSFLGYNSKSLFVNEEVPANIVFELEPADYALNEIVIKPKRERYKKKGNPAVEFVEKVIARKKQNVPYDKDYYSYQKYEKFTFALNDFDSVKIGRASCRERVLSLV